MFALLTRSLRVVGMALFRIVKTTILLIVLKDKRFLPKNPQKRLDQLLKNSVLEWSSDDKIAIDHFSQSLVATLYII